MYVKDNSYPVYKTSLRALFFYLCVCNFAIPYTVCSLQNQHVKKTCEGENERRVCIIVDAFMYAVPMRQSMKQSEGHSEIYRHWEYERLSFLKYCLQNNQLSRKAHIRRTCTKHGMVHNCDGHMDLALQKDKISTK